MAIYLQSCLDSAAALFGCLATSTKTILAESLLHGYKFHRSVLLVVSSLEWCYFNCTRWSCDAILILIENVIDVSLFPVKSKSHELFWEVNQWIFVCVGERFDCSLFSLLCSINTVYYMSPFATMILGIPALLLEGNGIMSWFEAHPVSLVSTHHYIQFWCVSLLSQLFHLLRQSFIPQLQSHST